MKKVWRRGFTPASALALLCAGALLASVDAAPGRADGIKAPGYLPGLGDLMNASMQVHHTKLWLAGNDGNWALAAYELKEIKETVEDIQTYSPKWHGIPVAQMVKGLDPSINSLNQGVIAKNSIKFNADFREFTAACNACHVAANQPEIKIMVPLTPDANKFADQDFTAGGRSQK